MYNSISNKWYIKLFIVLLCFLILSLSVIPPIQTKAEVVVSVLVIGAVVAAVCASVGVVIHSSGSGSCYSLGETFSNYCKLTKFEILSTYYILSNGILKIAKPLYNQIVSFLNSLNITSSASSAVESEKVLSNSYHSYDRLYYFTSLSSGLTYCSSHINSTNMNILTWINSGKTYPYSLNNNSSYLYFINYSYVPSSTIHYFGNSFDYSYSWDFNNFTSSRLSYGDCVFTAFRYSDTNYCLFVGSESTGEYAYFTYNSSSPFFNLLSFEPSLTFDTPSTYSQPVSTTVDNTYVIPTQATSSAVSVTSNTTEWAQSVDTALSSDEPIQYSTQETEPVGYETVSTKYGVTGLQDIFPFCIPFDIVDIFKNLQATREAPELDIHIDNSMVAFLPDSFNYTMHLDLEDWDSVASLLRTLEIIAFVVGLALVSRKLIGG